MDEQEPERALFLAVSEATYSDHFSKPLFQAVIERKQINLVIFDEVEEEILQWIRQ